MKNEFSFVSLRILHCQDVFLTPSLLPPPSACSGISQEADTENREKMFVQRERKIAILFYKRGLWHDGSQMADTWEIHLMIKKQNKWISSKPQICTPTPVVTAPSLSRHQRISLKARLRRSFASFVIFIIIGQFGLCCVRHEGKLLSFSFRVLNFFLSECTDGDRHTKRSTNSGSFIHIK